MKTIEKVQAHPACAGVADDRQFGDGYWVYTKPGWMIPEMDCHTIHESSIAECYRLIKTAVPCGCRECKDSVGRWQCD